MNPYDIDVNQLVESQEITDVKQLIKLQLLAEFHKATRDRSSEEILDVTGLDKADLSRLRSMSIEHFTIDRMITLLDSLGYSVTIKVKRHKNV